MNMIKEKMRKLVAHAHKTDLPIDGVVDNHIRKMEENLPMYDEKIEKAEEGSADHAAFVLHRAELVTTIAQFRQVLETLGEDDNA